MSFESDSYFRPAPALLRSIKEFLSLLGYRRIAPSPFQWRSEAVATMSLDSDRDYESFSGVYLVIYRTKRRGIHVYTRTNSWCSRWDLDQQIRTVRLLKKHFGGTFHTDEGKGRYWRNEQLAMSPAEAGCFLAFERFQNNIQRLIQYFDERQFAPGYSDPKRLKLVDMLNPRLFSNNLLLPYLVSALEDYFKSAYIALARYSNDEVKQALFRNARIPAERLVAVASRESALEEVLADAMSFQNIDAICGHFRAVNRRIDFAGVLRKPLARRRRMSLFDALRAAVQRRHALIHRNVVDLSFEDVDAARAIDDVYAGIRRCHEHLTTVHGWAPNAISPPLWKAAKRLRLKKRERPRAPQQSRPRIIEHGTEPVPLPST